jgi:glycosyltransferase involved in cell wall biosynthesis
MLATCKFDVLKPCLESILQHTDLQTADAEIIVAMNGCEEEALDYVRNLITTFKSRIRFIWVDRRIGAVATYNLAAQISEGEYLVKMDDDITILDWGGNNTWLNLLLEPYSTDQGLGQTGVWVDKTWGDYYELHGFLTITPKKVWDEIGGLDMAFNPGYGDDADYSIRVQKAGYRIAENPPTAVVDGKRITYYPAFHASRGEYFFNSKQKVELALRNRALLRERYGYPTDPKAREQVEWHEKIIEGWKEELKHEQT